MDALAARDRQSCFACGGGLVFRWLFSPYRRRCGQAFRGDRLGSGLPGLDVGVDALRNNRIGQRAATGWDLGWGRLCHELAPYMP